LAALNFHGNLAPESGREENLCLVHRLIVPLSKQTTMHDVDLPPTVEETLAGMRRNLQTLYQCNRALIRATEEYELLQSVCQILVDVGGLRMVWIGYRQFDQEKTIRPVAIAGYDEGYVETIKGTWANSKRGHGPSGTAIRTGKPSWTKDIRRDANFATWQGEALKRGYGSSIALPLMADGEPFGAFSLYAAEPDAFNESTLEQFTELANNLAYGVMALRTREERKHAEDRLRRSESYLAEGERLSHTGSWGLNISSGELFWSQESYRIFGLDSGTALNRDLLTQFHHPEDRLFVKQTIDTAICEGRDFEMDSRLVLTNGSVKHVHTVGHPVFNESGELTEAIGVVMDTTQRKRSEEALREAQAELARVARATTMGELTASIAHEVNQPLAAVVTNASACLRWLAAETPNLDEARAATQGIVRDANRASDVIARIRGFLKKGEPVTVKLSVNDVVQEIIMLTQGEVLRRDASLLTELADRLPAVSADRVQLQQLLLNLIMNALDAMSAVTDRPRVLRIRTSTYESAAILVALRDSGMGLNPEQMERLFEAFYTTKPEGMGMGLSISRSIVEKHGGRLWATPNDGCGATFQFTLPIEQGGAV
jgi:PAS domain S-box-containing protein